MTYILLAVYLLITYLFFAVANPFESEKEGIKDSPYTASFIIAIWPISVAVFSVTILFLLALCGAVVLVAPNSLVAQDLKNKVK